MINKPEYQKAEQAAQGVLQELGYMDPPVDVLDVAAYLGLSVRQTVLSKEYKDVAGFIDIQERVITVNKEDPINRRIFTIAHEIGHYVLHKDEILHNPGEYQVLYRNSVLTDANIQEKEANYFAASLLVPESMLAKFRRYSSAVIAELFGVSQQVIAYRLKNLDRNIWRIGSILPNNN